MSAVRAERNSGLKNIMAFGVGVGGALLGSYLTMRNPGYQHSTGGMGNLMTGVFGEIGLLVGVGAGPLLNVVNYALDMKQPSPMTQRLLYTLSGASAVGLIANGITIDGLARSIYQSAGK